MKLQERGLEQFFYYGHPTEALVLFARALMTIKNDGEDWKRLRKPETLAAMLGMNCREDGEGRRTEILKLMDTLPVAFIPNKYPYNGIFPADSDLFHTCLFSSGDSLCREVVVSHIGRSFPHRPAVVFENAPSRKSIPLPHYHVVVDRKG